MKRLLLPLALILAAGLGGGYFWLQQHATGNVETALAQFEADLPDGASFTYTEARAEPLDNSATLTEVRFAMPEGQVFSAASLLIGDVTTDDEGVAETVGRVSGETVRLEIPGDNARTISVEQFDAADLQAGMLREAIDGRAALWPSFDRLTFAKLRVDSADSDRYFAAGSGEAAGITDGTIASMRMDKVEILALDPAGERRSGEPDRRLTTAREMEFRDLDFAFFTRLQDPENPPAAEARGMVRVIAQDLAVDRNGVRSATLDTMNFLVEITGDMSVSATFDAEGVNIPVGGQANDGRGGLKELGYDELNGRISASLELDGPEGDMQLGFDVTLREAAGIALALDLAGMPPLHAGEANRIDGEALKKVMLRRVEIEFRDDSLTGRLLDQQAGDAGLDRATFATQRAEALRELAAKMETPSKREALAALAAFVEAPGTLHIVAQPPAGTDVPAINVLAIAVLSPIALLQAFDVEVTRE